MRYELLEVTETVQEHPKAFKEFKEVTKNHQYGPGATHQAWAFFLTGWLAHDAFMRRNRMGVGG